MNRRAAVLATAAFALLVFAGGAWYMRGAEAPAPSPVLSDNALIRQHSPVTGPVDAPVTIVEFLDPSCEACRAFYPVVKQIMGAFPKDVRLVIRYTPLHEGSDQAVKILEAARLQDKFEPVLEATFARQGEWAIHGAPDIAKFWEIVGAAGLDTDKARQDAALPEIEAVLQQDMADLKENNIRQTPTFFVNGKPLPSFGAQQLYDLVAAEVKAAHDGPPTP